jgi:hypothetical protein
LLRKIAIALSAITVLATIGLSTPAAMAAPAHTAAAVHYHGPKVTQGSVLYFYIAVKPTLGMQINGLGNEIIIGHNPTPFGIDFVSGDSTQWKFHANSGGHCITGDASYGVTLQPCTQGDGWQDFVKFDTSNGLEFQSYQCLKTKGCGSQFISVLNPPEGDANTFLSPELDGVDRSWIPVFPN